MLSEFRVGRVEADLHGGHFGNGPLRPISPDVDPAVNVIEPSGCPYFSSAGVLGVGTGTWEGE